MKGSNLGPSVRAMEVRTTMMLTYEVQARIVHPGVPAARFVLGVSSRSMAINVRISIEVICVNAYDGDVRTPPIAEELIAHGHPDAGPRH